MRVILEGRFLPDIPEKDLLINLVRILPVSGTGKSKPVNHMGILPDRIFRMILHA